MLLTLVRRRVGTGYCHVKVAEVVVVRRGRDAGRRVGHEPLGLLCVELSTGNVVGRVGGSVGEGRREWGPAIVDVRRNGENKAMRGEGEGRP